MLKQFLRDYFSYSAKERRAIIFLVIIILTFIFIPAFIPVFIGSVSYPVLDSVRMVIVNQEHKKNANEMNSMLNPDYVENNEGIKTDRPVQPLRSKQPSANIPSNVTSTLPFNAGNAMVDINTAVLDDLLRMPGLDERIAKRILAFREKLGGFYSVEQLKETYGLDTAVFANIHDRLSVGAGVFRKININTAGFDELRSHPYIRYQLANALLDEREKNGDYTSVESIQKIQLVTPEIYSKLAAYLKTH
jgi:competence ComEA-like helix-hairpin-helix protein